MDSNRALQLGSLRSSISKSVDLAPAQSKLQVGSVLQCRVHLAGTQSPAGYSQKKRHVKKGKSKKAKMWNRL
jgi:hypothetical protein